MPQRPFDIVDANFRQPVVQKRRIQHPLVQASRGSSGTDIVLNENQKSKNQKVSYDAFDIEGYKARCEAHEVSYYDAFMASKDLNNDTF
ncbi:hypothetical protein LWI28_017782 [Acer negundo]|uniref:Uncharacterized protein n=1 Tax=Acer negundo TaxID=4023 RepID=A0AAD5NRQ5_ACENE|nr:hypothetical protein LWI28_017782 [Acer negundo]